MAKPAAPSRTGRQPAHAGDRVCRAEQGHPGALSAGTAAATAIAQHLAITNCWLGATVGAWYYAVFPVAASAGLVAATTGAMLAAVGVVTALAWIVLDPARDHRDTPAPARPLRHRPGRGCVEAAAARIGSVITTSRGCSMCWICCAPPRKAARPLWGTTRRARHRGTLGHDLDGLCSMLHGQEREKIPDAIGCHRNNDFRIDTTPDLALSLLRNVGRPMRGNLAVCRCGRGPFDKGMKARGATPNRLFA